MTSDITLRSIVQAITESDVRALTPDARTTYYLSLCEALGLDPRFKPIEFLEFNGRVIPYVNRGGTDALARRDGIQRTIVERPRVIKMGDAEIVVCVARATDRTGRYEERTATCLMRDPANVFMKCETKAIRRATLALYGVSFIDESELSGMGRADTLAEPARAEATAAYLECAVERLRAELPSLANATREHKATVWASHVNRLASEAAITRQEAHTLLNGAIRR